MRDIGWHSYPAYTCMAHWSLLEQVWSQGCCDKATELGDKLEQILFAWQQNGSWILNIQMFKLIHWGVITVNHLFLHCQDILFYLQWIGARM